MKIFYQLFLALLLGLILIVSVDQYFSYREEIRQFEEDLIQNGIQDGLSISGMIRHVWLENGRQKALELLEDASVKGKLQVRWVWSDNLKNPAVKYDSDLDIHASFLAGIPFSLKTESSEPSASIYTYVPVPLGLEKKGGLEIVQSLSSLKKYKKQMFHRAVMITSILAIVFGTILYLYITLKIRKPIELLMAHAQKIGEGDLSPGHALPKDNELGQLSETMNDMCSRLLISHEKIKFEYEARIQAIEQLRHTEQLSNLGILSAGIAHEIGNPLSVIEGRAKMIRDEDLTIDELRHNGSIIHKQCGRISTTIRQLLDYSRRPKQHISRENMQFVVKQVFQLLYPMAKKQQVAMHLSVDEDTETNIEVDGSQIQQVFVNLLMNSIQAMPLGGDIFVRISHHIEKNRDKENSELPCMKIEICDEGGGIDPKNIKEIFTPFFTTKTLGKGTGLGLSIAHEIVEEHDGWITVKNLDKGSCFTIYLPTKGRMKCEE